MERGVQRRPWRFHVELRLCLSASYCVSTLAWLPLAFLFHWVLFYGKAVCFPFHLEGSLTCFFLPSGASAVRGGEDPALQHPLRALRVDRLPPQVRLLQRVAAMQCVAPSISGLAGPAISCSSSHFLATACRWIRRTS